MGKWSEQVVGRRYRNPEGNTYACTEYDPRIGFWMENVANPSDRRNVSERAIDRTYHHVRMSFGAWRHLEQYEKLGRTPASEELNREEILHELTRETLLRNGLIDSNDALTDRGRRALESEERKFRSHLEF